MIALKTTTLNIAYEILVGILQAGHSTKTAPNLRNFVISGGQAPLLRLKNCRRKT